MIHTKKGLNQWSSQETAKQNYFFCLSFTTEFPKEFLKYKCSVYRLLYFLNLSDHDIKFPGRVSQSQYTLQIILLMRLRKQGQQLGQDIPPGPKFITAYEGTGGKNKTNIKCNPKKDMTVPIKTMILKLK